MIQKNGVLKREDNCISSICTRPATVLEDYPAITVSSVPGDMIEQTCISEVGEEICVIRTTPNVVNTLVKIIKRLSHLGSGKLNDSSLESRQNMHHNITIKRIGL